LGRLNQEEELILIKQMASLPEVVEKTAQDFLPHLIPYYLQALATQFHSFYTKHRVISEDQELSKARLLLCDCVRIVLRNGLNLIGVSAPAKM
jgi:arginyl-tRNA synthetase